MSIELCIYMIVVMFTAAVVLRLLALGREAAQTAAAAELERQQAAQAEAEAQWAAMQMIDSDVQLVSG